MNQSLFSKSNSLSRQVKEVAIKSFISLFEGVKYKKKPQHSTMSSGIK